MTSTIRQRVIAGSGVFLTLFTLAEINYPQLTPQSQLAIFAGLGLVICFLHFPASRRPALRWLSSADWLLALLALAVCGYMVVQTEPFFSAAWFGDTALGDRAGAEVALDFIVGFVGVALVLEATRRCVGVALPILAVVFLLYASFGSQLPDWLFPHRGYSWSRIVSQTFLHSQGVFGTALKVMFTYVFLFVVFGALLEACGATQFIIVYAQRLFRGQRGGPAKVSVLSSGLMGSLSGSAVANTATTGTFTIPLMRSSGFKPYVAAGVEAAASSGGALVPPVMGAGAYMMLEIVEPPVTYLEIIRAALLPAILYYLSLFLIVHFYAKRLAASGASLEEAGGSDESGNPLPLPTAPSAWSGLVFVLALGLLIVFILLGYTVFRAVTLAMIGVLVLSSLHATTRMSGKTLLAAVVRAGRNGVALVAAAACVGIVIGVVTLTGIGTKLPAVLLPLAEESVLLALFLIMLSTLILGMGLPSAVCYLLMATLIGPVIGELGLVPLAAHLFIFYFGMMAMVTPPVALAAYTAASIADTSIMRSAMAAFRFALVGFTLPFLFVLRPSILMLGADGGVAAFGDVTRSVVLAVLGIVPLAAGIAGFLRRRASWPERTALLVAALLLLLPVGPDHFFGLSWADLGGFVILTAVVAWQSPKSGG